MSRRKPHNMRTRLERSFRATLRSNHVAVVNIDPSGNQGLINWKNCRSIPPGQRIADAVCDFPHRWSIYLAALCIDQHGQRYIKSIEAEPAGNYLAALCIDQHGQRYIKSIEAEPAGNYLASDLTEVIETCYRGLLDECNPKHLVGSGWIANPSGVSMTEEEAARVFDAVGAWPLKEAA